MNQLTIVPANTAYGQTWYDIELNQTYKLEGVAVQMHDIEHLIYNIGYSSLDERAIEIASRARLSQKQWGAFFESIEHYNFDELDPDYAYRIRDLPEYYSVCYGGEYSLEKWFALFDEYKFLPTSKVEILIVGSEVIIN